MNGCTVEWRASNRPCPESVCLEYALSTAGSRQNLVELGLVNTAGAQRVENQFPAGSYQLYDWGHCLGEISYSRCCRTDPCASCVMRSWGPGVWSEERLTGFKPTAWCKGMRMRKLSSMSSYNILHSLKIFKSDFDKRWTDDLLIPVLSAISLTALRLSPSLTSLAALTLPTLTLGFRPRCTLSVHSSLNLLWHLKIRLLETPLYLSVRHTRLHT